ncbi:molybdopterin-dependent oxidoreductase [Bisbaumannia pacifica]|uniref:Oxidoreductase n=1 Tax=Bisbaumannia pacifica TaxID=77098 RepID=A0A510X813_9GAMM|nr:molybdopterin-dependent oxidoreductase [Halomonas pacifica]GEK47582.1 oxidoreductase [Halomonas pacifica]
MRKLAIAWRSLLCACLFLPTLAAAHELRDPEGPVLLIVSGDITHTNRGNEAHFDRRMLEALPWRSIETTTPWTDGVSRYRGPLARALLEAVGARGDSLEVTALNNFMAEIPVSDFRRHDVILAMERDGDPMRIRDYGPLFVLYPFDQHPELRNETIRFRSVWQVHQVTVR